MIQVRIDDIDANGAVNIVYELRDIGWQQGQDFEFAYRHARYDSYHYELQEPKHAVFLFYNEEYATMFRLKYL